MTKFKKEKILFFKEDNMCSYKKITGKHQLNAKELEDKLGVMAHTSKDCATGTCWNPPPLPTPPRPPMPFKNIFYKDFSEISNKNDSKDAFVLKEQLGSLY
jgi:hypothetical protein